MREGERTNDLSKFCIMLTGKVVVFAGKSLVYDKDE